MRQGYTAVAQRAYILLRETLPRPHLARLLQRVVLDPQTTGRRCAHSERGRERNLFHFLKSVCKVCPAGSEPHLGADAISFLKLASWDY